MKIHEYQAKELFIKYGLACPPGRVADTVEEARQAARSLGGGRLVVKAQIHAGGRGKGGGVALVEGVEAAAQAAGRILGMNLKTPQTGPEGRLVRRVLIEKASPIERELYLGVTMDRAQARPVVMVSPDGGMDIEAVAQATPERIFMEGVDIDRGFQPFQGRQLARALGFSGKAIHAAAAFLGRACRLFYELDASLVEINPLAVTTDGELVALDAKIDLDDNALFRHPELKALEDPNEMDPLELAATSYGLNYIRLDGQIGAMVNGAGLAMATMDLIQQAGASPANFLDVGGGASSEMIARGFEIILGDERVRAILINIFGGILRCDVFAKGVIEAAAKAEVRVPVIIRLEGTNREQGQRLLDESGLSFTVARDLSDAAVKVAALVK